MYKCSCKVCFKDFKSKQKSNICSICHLMTLKVKKKLILMGETPKCLICGFDTICCLDFHHIDPSTKEFTISNTPRNLEDTKAEVKKCVILCSNCHRQVHSGFYIYNEKTNKFKRIKDNLYTRRLELTKKKLTNIKKVYGKCLTCGKQLFYGKTKYCSYEHMGLGSRKVKDRPSKEQLLKELSESNFLQIGKKYGVSDNAIRRWLK